MQLITIVAAVTTWLRSKSPITAETKQQITVIRIILKLGIRIRFTRENFVTTAVAALSDVKWRAPARADPPSLQNKAQKPTLNEQLAEWGVQQLVFLAKLEPAAAAVCSVWK